MLSREVGGGAMRRKSSGGGPGLGEEGIEVPVLGRGDGVARGKGQLAACTIGNSHGVREGQAGLGDGPSMGSPQCLVPGCIRPELPLYPPRKQLLNPQGRGVLSAGVHMS